VAILIAVLQTIFYALAIVVITFGFFSLSYYPLSLLAEMRHHPKPVFHRDPPLVTIVVPAYNEGKVIKNCIESILRAGYKRFELILVDDGSKDDTYAIMQKYSKLRNVKAIAQINAGKAAALNRGVKEARGEFLFFVDADGIFTHNTIPEMLKQFYSEKVWGVCGTDVTANLNNIQTQLYCLQTHVGTSFVRRALAEINCLPIISGNNGLFRRTALIKTILPDPPEAYLTPEGSWPDELPGPFLEGFIVEDLELTWRIHKAGYRVNFASRGLVLSEVPSTVKGLWKQRVRWARGLLQTVRIHHSLFFNLKIGPMGLYLPLNYYNQVINPIIQLLLLIIFIILIATGHTPISLTFLNLLLYFGLGMALFASAFAITLDHAWKDLRFLYVVPLWAPYSIMMDLVMVWAIILELRGKPAAWNKIDRTGVVSRR
jgi:cellulose synthase/poly-beta-1,6-N-acetylglucosamine synthase-like glycosyltransferase